MSKILRTLIEEIDYYFEVEWDCAEFPVVSDFIRIVELCTDEQRKEFESMDLPRYLHTDFQNTIEYLKYYRWQITERCWQSKDCLSINCHKVDPTIL